MTPTTESPLVVVAEPHQDIADALQDVVALAGCVPIVVSRYESVSDLQSVPAAIVVRVAMEMPMMSPHRGLQESSLTQRPLIVALASNDADVAEAERLGCEIIARAPHQVQALYQALTRLSSR